MNEEFQNRAASIISRQSRVVEELNALTDSLRQGAKEQIGVQKIAVLLAAENWMYARDVLASNRPSAVGEFNRAANVLAAAISVLRRARAARGDDA